MFFITEKAPPDAVRHPKVLFYFLKTLLFHLLFLLHDHLLDHLSADRTSLL